MDGDGVVRPDAQMQVIARMAYPFDVDARCRCMQRRRRMGEYDADTVSALRAGSLAGDIVVNVLRLAKTGGTRPSLNAAMHLTSRGVKYGVDAIDGEALFEPPSGQPHGADWHRLRTALDGRRISRGDLLATWRRYRTVAHLWAAALVLEWQQMRNGGTDLPYLVSGSMSELAALSEAVLSDAAKILIDSRDRREPLLCPRTAHHLILPGVPPARLSLPALNPWERKILAASR
jgi:hypothetical protein